ncbi:hypothetical protein [Halopenitus malekzadehii]|uniref:hypothetical protein n=1 Tax=Halopenitus malekzadehii TaxID=1267564 RepID=UPI00115FC0B1|nr:hypothetical protein [Halopenitus malekzadehii]
MNIGDWIREAIRRGWKAFILAIISAFLLTNSATTLLQTLVDGSPFSPQGTVSLWLDGAADMVQGGRGLSVIAIGLVAALGTILSYTWHNLISKNFDATIGLYIAALGVVPFVFSSSIPNIIPTWTFGIIPPIAGAYFVIWQSK